MKKILALSLLAAAATLAACTPAPPAGLTDPSATPAPQPVAPQTTRPPQQTIVPKPCHMTAPRMPAAPLVTDATEGDVTITAASPDSGVYYELVTPSGRYSATSATSHTVTLPVGTHNVRIEARFSECGSGSAVGYYSTTVDAMPLPATLAAIETDLVTRINALRSTYSRSPLTVDTSLRDGARTWSTTLAGRSADSVENPHDTTWSTNLTGFTVKRENVFPTPCSHDGCSSKWVVSGLSGAAAYAHSKFVDSSGHLANMVAGDVSRIGVGVSVVNTPGPGMHMAVTERFAQPR